MSPLDLDLVVPTTYHTDSQRHARKECALLAGHVTLSATSLAPLANVINISVRLVQCVASAVNKNTTRRISCPLFSSTKDHSSRPNATSELVLQETFLSISCKEEFETYAEKFVTKSYFTLPIPANLPATTETSLGTITYVIEATAVTSHNESVTQRRPLNISCLMIQDGLGKNQHRLYFPKSKDIHGMTLSQNATPRSGPRISFTATLHTHWETAPAERNTEIRHLVVRELRWQAEEIVKVMSRPSDFDQHYSICEHHSVRKLCDGTIKGYWGSSLNPYIRSQPNQSLHGEEGEKPEIRIPFYFSISPRAMVTDAIDLAAYEVEARQAGHSSKSDLTRRSSFPSSTSIARAINVHHQLKIELLTGEDVFHRGTGKLVERRKVRTVVCPAVPLSVCEVSS